MPTTTSKERGGKFWVHPVLNTQWIMHSHCKYLLNECPFQLIIIIIAMDVMKMGNTVPRVGLKPTSGILDQCATITPHRLPDVTTIPMPTWLCTSLPQRSVPTTTSSRRRVY